MKVRGDPRRPRFSWNADSTIDEGLTAIGSLHEGMARRTARIVTDEAVMGGEPRIEGHRISVRQVADWVEKGDLSAKTVADRYDLDIADSTAR